MAFYKVLEKYNLRNDHNFKIDPKSDYPDVKNKTLRQSNYVSRLVDDSNFKNISLEETMMHFKQMASKT